MNSPDATIGPMSPETILSPKSASRAVLGGSQRLLRPVSAPVKQTRPPISTCNVSTRDRTGAAASSIGSSSGIDPGALSAPMNGVAFGASVSVLPETSYEANTANMIIPSDISGLRNVRLAVALPVLFVALGFLRLIYKAVYNIYFHPLSGFPGPKINAVTRLPLTRMITSGHAHKTLKQLHDKYGPVVRLGPDTIDFADPRAFKDLMGHSKGASSGAGENYKDPINARYKPHSIINANREDHARIRRVLAHGFSAQSMIAQQPLIQTQVDLLIQRLHEKCEGGDRALNMVSWYNWTTFDVIGDLAFGEPFGCLESAEYHPWVSVIFDSIHASVYRNHLAYSEMRVILARVIWNFDVKVADDSTDWTEQKLFGLWKKGPLNVYLTPRKAE
ncbi:cytochrome p450 [Colletotrichum musicola]|uniref:Cytochrome p450 n=1 Tax=Colletotrichum musicola TaxID=2175873 RepID=A0A8H6IQC1_9PEZI|nr:cytochrome p450 [Colletotrichum musicola]